MKYCSSVFYLLLNELQNSKRCAEKNEWSSADSCVSQRVNPLAPLSLFPPRPSVPRTITDGGGYIYTESASVRCRTSGTQNMDGRTISRPYSRQAVNSLCETINGTDGP